MNKAHIKGYDGLRGISVVFVLMSHLGLYWHLPQSGIWRARVWHLISGETGVYVFFSLSGFLITTLLLNEKARNGKISFRRFYLRRFLRLSPPLFVFFIVLAVLMLTHELKPAWLALTFSFLYLYNYVPDSIYTNELAHTWSLGVEEQFYLMWPVVINNLSLRGVYIFSSVVIILCAVIALFLPSPIMFKGQIFYSTSRWLLPALGPIMIGSLAALLMKSNRLVIRHFAGSRAALAFAVLSYSAPLFMPLFMEPDFFLIQTFGITVFLTWLLCHQESLAAKCLEFRLLSFVGKISYGIYVWQGLFLRNGPGGALIVQHPPWNILLTFIAAAGSYIFIERYVLAFKQHIK